jgi:hypothetical protein
VDLLAYTKSPEVWFLTVLLTGLLLLPIVRFIVVGWSRKRADRNSGADEKTIKLYFEQFHPNLKIEKGKAEENFIEHFDKRFGRHHYTFPGIFLFLIAFISIFLVSGSVAVWIGIIQKEAGVLPGLVVSALSGAYMWVLGDLIVRNRCLNMSPANLTWGAYRFVIVIPFSYAMVYIFNESIAIPVAFLVGAFPTKTLSSILRRLASRQLNIGELGEKGVNELEQLQCINTSNAEAYSDEGISTILQLAYSDPLELMIKTSFNKSYVIDCISQALAWIYLEKDLEKLHKYSLRGAQEISTFIDEFDGKDDKSAQSRAKSTLKNIAAELNMDPISLERTLREIAVDPYTKFLCDIWT